MMDQPPADRPAAVTIAPNESKVSAKVLAIDRSPDWHDKWLLDLELITSERIQGPHPMKPGQRIRAFAFGAEPPARLSDVIQARAEYIGDARGGQLRLSDVAVRTGPPMLSGTVQFAGEKPDLSAARVYVTIEDVSRVDQSSQVVAQQSLDLTPSREGGVPAISFTLPVDQLEGGKSYSVRVHVDVDGDGSVSAGDYVTTQSYPVTRESSTVTVTVHRV